MRVMPEVWLGQVLRMRRRIRNNWLHTGSRDRQVGAVVDGGGSGQSLDGMIVNSACELPK
ncbi:hypothetical protein SE17_02055 [Kouleothrix aurantiaca]|uniref:Uncharacterized protein n=1 Tax=Kouleothrix aurantiaca TaxID=186479 RepID=A0A0P9HIM9_9CHLR|nr:hypothetical protein SE17_02055 [Kouleothrix aurantiaca]